MPVNLIRTAVLTVLAALALGAQSMPRLLTVEPADCKAGAEAVVKGENLSKTAVAELYLTDGKNDVKVTIVTQAADNIKFKIPAEAKAGRFSLMLMTAGADPKLIEQPVKMNVQ